MNAGLEAWTEGVTLVSETHVPDAVHEEAPAALAGAEGLLSPNTHL